MSNNNIYIELASIYHHFSMETLLSSYDDLAEVECHPILRSYLISIISLLIQVLVQVALNLLDQTLNVTKSTITSSSILVDHIARDNRFEHFFTPAALLFVREEG